MSVSETMHEQFKAIVTRVEENRMPVLDSTTHVIAQICNGGFSQAIMNGYNLKAVLAELDALDEVEPFRAFRALLELAISFGPEPEEWSFHDGGEDEDLPGVEVWDRWNNQLDHLDTIFYAGLDERLVEALHAAVVKE